jgi:hypothetical protein
MKPRMLLLYLWLLAPGALAGDLDRLGWMAGHWTSLDGAAEEVWLEPRGGTMTGSFRWLFPNRRQVLEYIVIEETAEGVLLRFKHYDSNFEPWEKDEPNIYRMQSLTETSVSFELLNEQPRVPRYLRYHRRGDTLTFLGESPGDDAPVSLTFRLGR